MEEEFVPYNESLELKEIEFDEPCFGLFVRDKSLLVKEMPNQNECEIYFGGILAPTFSQAFRWFREKHGLFAEITLWGDGLGYISMIKEIKQEEFIEVYKKDIVDTGLSTWKYEKAELACLRKLIEIVKKNNHGK